MRLLHEACGVVVPASHCSRAALALYVHAGTPLATGSELCLARLDGFVQSKTQKQNSSLLFAALACVIVNIHTSQTRKRRFYTACLFRPPPLLQFQSASCANVFAVRCPLSLLASSVIVSITLPSSIHFHSPTAI
jgi:hypothetical protein